MLVDVLTSKQSGNKRLTQTVWRTVSGYLRTEGNAMNLREIYENTGPDATINFFLNAGKKPNKAFLASPFFTRTFPDPIEELTRKGCDVQLVVRFSPITTPEDFITKV